MFDGGLSDLGGRDEAGGRVSPKLPAFPLRRAQYFRLRKLVCGFKDHARACHPGEKCRLDTVLEKIRQVFPQRDAQDIGHNKRYARIEELDHDDT